ncbi:MAG: hypothetical protein J0L84_19820, partial [Verrucomicrobia bacterium]|nr:hypothetical protein [Verrucomicrobiota bacterium]
MNKETCLELQALIDGELNKRQRDALLRKSAADAESQHLVEALTALRETVRGHEPEHRVPESREFYWSRIQQRIAANPLRPATATPARWDWLRWLVPVAGAAAVAALLSFPRTPEPSELAVVSPRHSETGPQLASSVTY